MNCERCAIWNPKYQEPFATPEAALQHLVECHPNRLVALLLKWLPDNRIKDCLDDSKREKQ